MAQKVTT